MQFAENFHQNKPAPVQFARAARAIMSEDADLTAADVSRLVGGPAGWARKALRLLDLPEPIVERVGRADLSFTVADLVRRGIARGDVSPADAQTLVAEHAEGRITGGALKLGVGYVPPKPKDYDELSHKLDEARWPAGRAGDGRQAREDAAAQRDWDAAGADRAPAARTRPEPVPTRAPAATGTSLEDLDAYLLDVVLACVAGPEDRAALGVTDEAAAHRYAAAIRPDDRVAALRTVAADLLAADPAPPRRLRRATQAA